MCNNNVLLYFNIDIAFDMKNAKYVLLLLFIATVIFSSCSSIPDHAKLIPANAVVVAGVNTKEIGKKIAWNAIIGSKLFDEMKKQQPAEKQDAFDPEKMGIELMSTSYVYIKADTRFSNENRITALVPLEDAGKWEAFIKTSFPGISISKNNDHNDAMLAEGMYAGWNKELLIIMNTPNSQPVVEEYYEEDTTIVAQPKAVDYTLLAAEMDNAFHTTKENALTGNEKFSALEKNGHDITLWINYDVLMGQYGSKGMSDMIGLPLSNTLWKDAAFTAGFDFEKGKITGDIKYYMPEEMTETGKEFGKSNIDKEMLDRLPNEDLDALIAWHIAPMGLKSMLEKMGVLGFINLALTTQDLTADYILEAFTGDMVVSVNKFKLEKKNPADTVLNSNTTPYNGGAQFTYAIKINKKENFDKLMAMAIANNILVSNGAGSYTLASGDTSMGIAVKDAYMVISNRKENINNYISGVYKSKLPESAKGIYGNPMGLYFNAGGTMSTINTGIVTSPEDSSVLAESKKLLQDVLFTGGKFSNSAFHYEMNINFLNKEENSLLLLIDFATRVNNARTQSLMANK
jgi:hypothetical protein